MLCHNISKYPVELSAHLVPSMQLTCLLKGWIRLKQVSDRKKLLQKLLGPAWVLIEAISIAVKVFACHSTLLWSVELKGFI